MAKKNGQGKQTEETMNAFRQNVRKLRLAGFGVFGLMQDQLDDMQKRLDTMREDWQEFVEELVDRGENVETDSRERFNEFLERYRKQAKETGEKVESEWDKQVEGMAKRMNVPTAEDIEELTRKVNSLNRKVDTLKKQAQARKEAEKEAEKEAKAAS